MTEKPYLMCASKIAMQSFLPLPPGSCRVRVLGQPRFVWPRLQSVSCMTCNVHRLTRHLTFLHGSRTSRMSRGRSVNDATRALVSRLALHAALSGQHSWEYLGVAVAASAGDGHICAVREDGQLVCFGGNEKGQCDVPADLGPVVAVSADLCSSSRWSASLLWGQRKGKV